MISREQAEWLIAFFRALPSRAAPFPSISGAAPVLLPKPTHAPGWGESEQVRYPDPEPSSWY